MNLYRNGELSIDDAKRIDIIAEVVREKYNEYIGEYININNLTGTDLLLASTCRNTISTSIYDNLCRLELLEEKVQRNKIPEYLFFDEKGVLEMAKQILDKHRISGVKLKYIKKPKNTLLFIGLNIFKSIYLIANSWLWPKIFSVKKKPRGDVIYVDTFLFIDSIDEKGNYFERYYTGHEKYLPKYIVDSEWFVPTLVDIKHPKEFIKICKDLRKTNKQFLLQESWLTITDYVYAFFLSIMLPFRIKKYPLYKGYDLSEIFKRVVVEDIAAPALMKSLCQYRFIRRLSKEKIKIKHAINWAENQNIDRALNLGFKRYYSDVIVNGYQGFPVLEYYASTQPTCYELEAGTLPDILSVSSPPCVRLHRKICDKLKLQLSPAFRFSYLYDIEPSISEDVITLLIALPGFGINESKRMLKAYLDIADSMPLSVTVIVKQHPAFTVEKFTELIPEFGDRLFSHTEKKFPEIIGDVSVLISSASSVCVEAVALGIPVLIYGDRYGITKNTIPSIVPNEMWSIFYTSEELKQQLVNAIKKKKRRKIVDELFCQADESGAYSLFTSN